MGKPLLYTVNTNVQNLSVGDSVNVGSEIRKVCKVINASGESITINNLGYFIVDVSLTINATTVGDITFTLNKDGTPITGATQSKTVSAGYYNMCIPTVVKVNRCCGAELSLILSGVACEVTECSFRVVEV